MNSELQAVLARLFASLASAVKLAIVSFLLLFTPVASEAQNPPKVTVAYAAISPIFAGVWMAKEIGAFERHGLKSELVYISSGSITVQAMVGGNLDMSVAASNAVVSSILRGAPLVAVGSITNRPAMSLFVQPEISRPEQLQGKALAITRHGSSTHFLTLFALEKLGLKDKVKINTDIGPNDHCKFSDDNWKVYGLQKLEKVRPLAQRALEPGAQSAGQLGVPFMIFRR